MIYDSMCPFCGKDTLHSYGKGNILIGYVDSRGTPKIRTYFHNECYTKNRRGRNASQESEGRLPIRQHRESVQEPSESSKTGTSDQSVSGQT